MRVANIRRIATNYGLLVVGEVTSKAVTFMAFAYLARYLGPTTFGTIEFALALIMVLTLVVEAGFSPYGAREVAKNPTVMPNIASQIVAVRSILAVGAYVLLVGFVTLLNRPWHLKQLLLLYGLTLFFIPVLIPWVFQGLERMGVVAATQTLRSLGFAVGVFLFVREAADVWRVPIVELSGLFCAATFNLWMYERSYGRIWPRIEPGCLSLFRGALPIGLSQILWAVRMYFPLLALGLMTGEMSLGWFGAATRVVLALNAFGALYLFNLLPTLSRAANQSSEAVESVVSTSISVVAWSTTFVGAVGMAFAEPLMGIVYGPQYADGGASLRILIWLVPVALIAGHFRYTLVAHNAQRLDLGSAAFGVGTCIILAIVLVPQYGPMGAAVAVLASELVTLIVAYLFVRRRVVVIRIGRHLAGPLSAGFLMVTLVKVFPFPNLGLGGAVGILLYLSALAMLQPKLLADIRSVLVRGSS